MSLVPGSAWMELNALVIIPPESSGLSTLLSPVVLNCPWCHFSAASLNLDVLQHLEHFDHISAQPPRFLLSLEQVTDSKTSRALAAKQTCLQPSFGVYPDPRFCSP